MVRRRGKEACGEEAGCRVGHSVLFRSERSVLFHSKKRTLRPFPFFSKEWKRTEKYPVCNLFKPVVDWSRKDFIEI